MMQPLAGILAPLTAIMATLFVGQQPLLAQDDRLPVPDSAEQQKAVDRIQGVFPDEYKSNDKAVKAKLAKQLADLGRVEKDPVARFALYREAVRLASENGDVTTAMSAIDAMEAGYVLKASAVTGYALGNLSKSVQGAEDSQALADQCQRFATVLIDVNEFDQAKKILGYGFNAVRKIRDNERAVALREMAEQIDDIAKDFKEVEQFAVALKQNPDDATANLEVGRYECFIKGNWKAGLAHLAKGSDPAIKKLAEKTLADGDAQARYDIANGWWKQGAALDGVSRQRVQGYASRWYDQALPELTGLAKITAEKRIAEVAPAAETGGVAARRGPKTIDLLQVLDPDEDFKPKNKWQISNGLLLCTEGHFVPKVIFPYQPPEEYDVTYIFEQPSLRNGVGVLMPNPNGASSFSFSTGFDGGRGIGLGSDQDKYIKRFPRQVIHANVKYAVVVKVRKEGVQAYINGQQVANVPTDFSDLKVGGFHRINEVDHLALFCDDKTVFHKVEVTEVTGEGAMTRFPKEE